MYKLIFKIAIETRVYNESVFYDKILKKIGINVTNKQFYIFRVLISFLGNLFISTVTISLLKTFWGVEKSAFLFLRFMQ